MDTQVILQRFAANTITEEERAEFAGYLKTLSGEDYEALMEQYEAMAAKMESDQAADPVLFERIQTAIGVLEKLEWHKEGQSRRTGRVWRMVFIPAACVILIAGIYLLLKPKQVTPVTATTVIAPPIAPGGNKAILTLANGASMVLDSIAIGGKTTQGAGELVKLADGKLQYRITNKNVEAVQYNTLTTPRGGKYQVALSDGTKVWLNAASAIRYPTVFMGKTREVEVSGEVYFEVAHDEAHPFKVTILSKNKERISLEVLGTSFNIKDYPNETDNQVQATLVQGSVNVSMGEKSVRLRPGQQANVNRGDQRLHVKSDVDVESITAWVNGNLVLNGADVQEFMEEISRWYDVDVRYQSKIPAGSYFGLIDRDVPLDNVLNVLNNYGIKTRMEARTIIVQ